MEGTSGKSIFPVKVRERVKATGYRKLVNGSNAEQIEEIQLSSLQV